MPLWQKCVRILENQFKEEEISRWIQPLKSTEDDESLSLTAPNSSIATWFIQNCFAKSQAFLDSVAGRHIRLTLRIASPSDTCAKTDKDSENQSDTPSATPSSINPCLNPQQTFESFVVGKSNHLASAIALQVAESCSKQYNPLFLYSGVGLGKTHLLNAVGHHILQNNPKASVLYLSSERFVKDLVHAIRERMMDKFKSFYRNFDVLLIDDIQFLAGKERSQEEFFHTYNYLLQKNTQLVMTCNRYPSEINNLDERLKSRFVAGIAQSIDRPDIETRINIVLSKAELCNLPMPRDVAEFVAQNIHTNVREIEGAVRRMHASAEILGRTVDIALAEETLRDAFSFSKTLSIKEIQLAVAKFYKIDRQDLLSKSRRQAITFPRHMAMALAKKMTNQSLPSIGDAFGGRDHTTVLYACRKISKVCKGDMQVNHVFCKLQQQLSR